MDRGRSCNGALRPVRRIEAPPEVAAEADIMIFAVPGSEQTDCRLDAMLAKGGPHPFSEFHTNSFT